MPKQTTIDALRALVAARIVEAPYQYGGHAWAACPLQWYCDKLGISLATLKRMTGAPPFVRQRVKAGGKIVSLLRDGEPAPQSKKHSQNKLASIWRKKTGRSPGGKAYGHMAGLLDHWGIDHAEAILKMVLDNWPAFMAGVKTEVAMLGDEGYDRYFQFPSSSVLLRFHHVGWEMYMMQKQEKMGKDPTYAVLGSG